MVLRSRTQDPGPGEVTHRVAGVADPRARPRVRGLRVAAAPGAGDAARPGKRAARAAGVRGAGPGAHRTRAAHGPAAPLLTWPHDRHRVGGRPRGARYRRDDRAQEGPV